MLLRHFGALASHRRDMAGAKCQTKQYNMWEEREIYVCMYVCWSTPTRTNWSEYLKWYTYDHEHEDGDGDDNSHCIVYIYLYEYPLLGVFTLSHTLYITLTRSQPGDLQLIVSSGRQHTFCHLVCVCVCVCYK